MKNSLLLIVLICGVLLIGCNKKRDGKPKVLVFSKTMGFKHASIPDGVAAIQKLGEEHGFEVDTTKNAAMFEEDSLKQYSAIIFLSTTGNVLDHKQEAAFERYIQAGGGFVGVHAATDTEYDWNWYGKMVGGYFQSHPAGTPEAKFIIKDKNFIATEFFEESVWQRSDELYNFKKLNPEVNVLLTVDESTYKGGENGDFHPMAWYHEYDGGRAFYTALGHTAESFSEDKYLKHLLGGIQYAIGNNEKLDYSKAISQLPPDADRFSKVPLVVGDFFEPTEMTILPNNDVLIAQRRGEILHYDAQSEELKQVASLDVYHKTLNTPGVNAEEGLMGLQKDPEYAENNWIYVYYAPTGKEQVNRLSRFKFEDNIFDLESEQVILDVESQREICCHTGGSIAFGPDNLLYLSTGDNSTPFDEPEVEYVNNGYAPLNDIPGHEQYDARRSSANTNDLRGKILRVKVNKDGTYDIPDGNLFPVGTEKTRPEIYTMGHRNPYRISVDPKKGYVYWGDIGPDARDDAQDTRGPRGYDEMNQAREPGNFGWPLFIADNKPYVDYDYETGESGVTFNPEKPVNDSKNNTGLKILPPAQPAYAFYPYSVSPDFPQLATGGRNAMAGPTYYSGTYADGGGLPQYYNGKVIIYDWMRGWMKAVSLFKDGTFNKMEPFASEIKVNNLIDMELGPDGRLYLLEYGSGWFSKNDNSGLSYVAFNGGNRPPVIDRLIVDKTSGKLPLSVNAEVKAMDREKDAISYIWNLGDGTTKETFEPSIAHTYDKAGEYRVSVEVKDSNGETAKSNATSVIAGNSRPEVAIDLKGSNPTFFMDGVPLDYKVTATDPDGDVNFDTSNVFVSVDYRVGMDEANMSLGHQQVSAAVTGKALTMAMDCKTCHKEKDASIGPNYVDIAQRYKDDDKALDYLKTKIVEGGSGVWGEVTMPAHPDVTSEESRQIALYIQSLAGEMNKKKSLPVEGQYTPKPTQGSNVMVLTASYTDNGGNGARPLTGVGSVVLRRNVISFSKDTQRDGFEYVNFNGMDLLVLPSEEGWFLIENVDMKGLGSAEITAGWQAPPNTGLDFEVRLNSPDGELIGNGSMPKPAGGQPAGVVKIKLEVPSETQASDIYFVYKPKEDEERGPAPVALMNIKFTGK